MIDIIGDQLVLHVKEFPVGANWLDTDSYQASWIIRRRVVSVVEFVKFEPEPEPLDGKEYCFSCQSRRPYSYFGKDERNTERHGLKSYCRQCCQQKEATRQSWVRAGKPGELRDYEYDYKPRKRQAA